MAKGKYLKKPNVSKVKSKPRFTSSKNMRAKIDILLGLGVLVAGLYGSIVAPLPVQAQTNIPENTNPHQDTKSAQICSIGVPNPNATITVDGQDIKIDPNSFVIVSEDHAHAYDESGNILKGYIDDSEFEEVFQLPEDQMPNYYVYQVISESGVNVRSSGEIADDNIISTVPSLDYVLGYTTNTPEYDGEWVSTLSINDNDIYNGYIREDLIREVGTFEAINNRPESNLEDLEKIMNVDTSRDGENFSLNLRSQPEISNKENILAKIPHGATVQVIGETIKSANRDWSRVVYETPDGNKIQGWVATNYLTSDIVQVQEVEQIQEDIPEIKTNASGSVTGIDVSSMSPEDLRELLQTGIPNSVKATVRKC